MSPPNPRKRTPKKDPRPAASGETDPGDDFNEDTFGRTVTVINDFFAAVDARKPAVGITGETTTRSLSGRLDPEGVERALGHLVRHFGFDRATAIPRERHPAVLAGHGGIGKRTSGTALLVRLTSIADEVWRQGAERERRAIEEDPDTGMPTSSR